MIKLILGILCFLLNGCMIESKLDSLYQGSNLYGDNLLLLNRESKKYYNRNGICDHIEIGNFSISGDTLFLSPKYEYEGDTVFGYNCLISPYYYAEEIKCIERRVFIFHKDYIQDITLSYYYPEDTRVKYLFSEDIPLRKIKIKQTKEEKASLKARQKYENLGK